MGKTRESIDMALASLPGLTHPGDTSATCNNIAMSYLSLRRLDQAQRYIDKSIGLDISSRKTSYLGIHRINKGLIFERAAAYTQAIRQLAQGISLTEQSRNKFRTVRWLSFMAFPLNRSGRTAEAVDALQRAEKLAIELGRNKEREPFAQSIEMISGTSQGHTGERAIPPAAHRKASTRQATASCDRLTEMQHSTQRVFNTETMAGTVQASRHGA